MMLIECNIWIYFESKMKFISQEKSTVNSDLVGHKSIALR